MVEAQLENAGISEFFERQLSVDSVRAFKPSRKVYEYAEAELVERPRDLWLVAAHNWDTSGALAAGWIENIVPTAGFDDYIAETASRIAGQPSEVVRAYKRMIDNVGAGMDAANADIRERALRSGVIDEKLAELGRQRRGAR